MKTLISILVLFSGSLFAANEKKPLHADTEYYANEIYNLIPSVQDIYEIEWYSLSRLLDGLTDNNKEDTVINVYESFVSFVSSQDDTVKKKFSDKDAYIKSSYTRALYKKHGFEQAYKFAMSLKEYDHESSLMDLFYLLKDDKNEVKMLFLLKENLYIFAHDSQYSESDKLSNKAKVVEILIEKNPLSAKLLHEELKNDFFSLETKSIRPNHEWLIKNCLELKDIECINQYMAKESDFKEGLNAATFEGNIKDIIIGLIKMEEFQLAEEYLKKYLPVGKIDEDDFMAINEIYPKAMEIYTELSGADISQVEFALKLQYLIEKHKELEGEEKHKAYDEINLLAFNNASKYASGGNESEKINNFFFNLASWALEVKDKELAYALASTGAINTRFEEVTLDAKEFKNIILLLINSGNFEFAHNFTQAFQLEDGLKNHIYARLARSAAIDGNEEMAKLGIDNWQKYKQAEPIIEKLWFKHEDDVVVYDKHLAVNLMINSAKTYLDETSKDEVKVFVKKFIDKDYDSSIFQWQTSDIEKFLEHLLNNNMVLEAVDIAKWYVEKYEEPEIDRLSSFGVDMEEFKFDFVEKVFVNLIKKNDLTSAFFILDYVDSSKVKSILTKDKIEKKQKKLLLRGGKLIEDNNIFDQYLEYFTIDQQFNLILERANEINGNWWY